jgi:hypothetical protein
LVLFLLAAAGVIRWLASANPPIPPFLNATEAQAALSATLPPSQFTDRAISEAYAAALKIPNVIAQQPCYCGCSQMGHRSLLDCYRSRHAADCSICVKEAILAKRLHEAGKTPTEIRTAIVEGQWTRIN